ncbi:binding-protein-dependent transport systems inner membrane component [Methanococcus maripaludis C5]|uniref:Binding-protein-dependent transport systems inner membrane component n=1 Tax=Methanococcus maripaludis (strain C5 / ATCC BAA-1333) TaxID=402880 RepID=A4G082_METM5|nr:iron ABC transporter permease [Methanococcus maripaludis]ABO35866.1 binding-protein-dependent transport systems inner membrane component [Methanococcus maripaludis C5]
MKELFKKEMLPKIYPKILENGFYILANAFLLLFIMYPIFVVFIQSVYGSNGFTLEFYSKFISDSYYFSILKNSVVVACFSTLISIVLGFIFSIIIFKTDFKFKNFFKVAVFLPIITPGFISSLAYVFLFGRHGAITYGLLGLEPSIYGWKSVVIMQSIDYTTTAFFIISAVLLGISGEFEDAARNLGSNEFQVFKKVTFPLLIPGILSAGLLIFMQSMADFGTPIIVGGNFNTLATASYFEIIGRYNTQMASTLSVVLLFPSLALFYLYSKYHKGYGLKKSKLTKYSLSNLQKTVLGIPAVFFSIIAYLLFFAVFVASFTKSFGHNYALTLDYFYEAIGAGQLAIKNTLVYSLSSSILVAFLGVAYSYIVYRGKFFGRKLMDLIITLPFAIPGTFMGLGYLLAFNNYPLLLNGTSSIIILNCMVRKLPFSFKTGNSVLSQIEESVEEASLNLGANRLKTFYKVVLPLLKPAIIFSMIYTFIATIKSLGSIIFLMTANTKVLSAMVFESTINRQLGVGACYSMFMVILSIIGILGILRLKGDKQWF